jgi:voltage-gated sodium channel
MALLERFFLAERKVFFVILLNAITIFALGFSQLPDEWVKTLTVVDDVITVVYLLEAATKIRAWGFGTYWKSHWNKFDLVLVAVSLPALALHVTQTYGFETHYFLAFRVCRSFKFFRFLRFVPGIEQMLSGVLRAMRASIMLVLAFFIVLFMVAVFSTKVFGEIDPEHFGDPLRSLYSTFKIFTVEGWFEIPDTVAEKLSGPAVFFTRAYFAAMLLGAGVMGLSLVNSVFVDAMMADNNDELNAKVDSLREEILRLREALTPATHRRSSDGSPQIAEGSGGTAKDQAP